ncbi:MAG: FAD-binding oxidoreductase [Treponemataceae bacterium]|nr:FAD-binding oxidoreductase [Treponemataceae bacterium]
MSSLLVGPLVVALVSSFLALVISLTDRLVNNYGEVTITVNGGKKILTVKGGSPLLTTLASQNIFVPSACGGRGSCGACKVRIVSDVGPHLPTELPYLNTDEVVRNVRLSCQIKVKKNLAIELPEVLFNVRKLKATVERIRNLTYDIKEVYLRLSDEAIAAGGISFTPGQYAQLVVPPYGELKESVQRAYSMSSTPQDKNHIEFLIRLVPGGIATTWVHQYLKEGDSVEVVGPFGEFGVRETDAMMIFVAGGSGMAPFKSILNHMAETGQWTNREIWYFFGARSKRDMFYLEEMAALEKRFPSFHFVPALSEPKPEDSWNGPVGLITNVLDSYFKERIPRNKPMEGYLCGSPGMIDACIKVMTANGISPEKIYYDKFA